MNKVAVSVGKGVASPEVVKSKSVRGVIILTGRTFILQIIAFAAQLLLFAYLGVYEFGVFAIVSAVINFLTYFSDIGLAAALIQKKDEPTLEDLRTTFTIQQILILTLVSLLFAFSSQISAHYQLNKEGMYLMYALGASLILSSLKSIPSVLLERDLEFVKLVFPQILETLVYNVALVYFAMNGFGVTSFTISVLLRGVVGLVVIYWIQPWKVGFAFSIKSIKDLFRFGVPYQLNSLLATVKDDGITLVLGSILNPAGVGILSFAQKIARYPLTFFMDTVTKVTFPAFARLQEEKEHLERSVTRSIFFICLLVFPSLSGIVVLMPLIIEVVPRYSKWESAIIPLSFIAINFAFAAATTQLTNLLNAIGKIKVTFYLMIMWTVLTWIFVPYLTFKYGVNGAAAGYGLVGISSIVAIYLARKYVNFSIMDSMIKPLVGTLIMSTVLIVLKRYLPVNLLSIQILVLAGIITYSVSMVSMIGTSLLDDAKRSLHTVFSKS